MAHPVIDALRDRPPGARIALVVEGGGMRGAVTGGMVLALDELGLHHAFDAAYGSSAGSLNAMWLISGRVYDGIPTWTDRQLVHGLIRKRRALRGRPVVDIRTLVERRYEQLAPGLFKDVLASPTELHPLATEVDSAKSIDLHPEIADEQSLQLALRATSTLPILAGPPVELNGRRLVDAGVSAAIPFRAALEQGATHVLVLRSRRHGDRTAAPGRKSAAITGRALRRLSPAVEQSFLTRAVREAEDEDLLDRYRADPALEPSILSIHPAPDSAVPSRLERNLTVVREALAAGRVAVHAAFNGRS